MKIELALTDKDIDACYPIMRELRPGIAREEFLTRVRVQEAAGYQIAVVHDNSDTVVDLITVIDKRSMGYGSAVLEWLRNYGIEHGCRQLHLDSGIQREQAHHFYEREGLSKAGYHFAMPLSSYNNGLPDD